MLSVQELSSESVHGFGVSEKMAAVGRGTGLGLSMAYSIVTGHFGGEVTLDTEVGRDSIFRVRIPIHAGSVSGPTSARTGEPHPQSPEPRA